MNKHFYFILFFFLYTRGNVVTECDSFYTRENRPEEFRESLNETSSNSTVEEHNTGKIVGVVLGAVASVILVLGLVIMVACKKCYSQEGHEKTESADRKKEVNTMHAAWTSKPLLG